MQRVSAYGLSEHLLKCIGEFAETWQREHCHQACQQADDAKGRHHQQVRVGED
jgi:hypothetical protein